MKHWTITRRYNCSIVTLPAPRDGIASVNTCMYTLSGRPVANIELRSQSNSRRYPGAFGLFNLKKLTLPYLVCTA